MKDPAFLNMVYGALIAGAVGFITGLITHLIISYRTKNDAKAAILVALTAELGVMRNDIHTHILGIRGSLRKERTGQDILPRIDDYTPPTVVFNANAGSLGLLRDPDLVENIVEVYSAVHSLRVSASRYSQFTNDQMTRQPVLEHHCSATANHLDVMKLHNRLKRGEDSGQHIEGTEEETRDLMDVWGERLEANPETFVFGYPLESGGSEQPD